MYTLLVVLALCTAVIAGVLVDIPGAQNNPRAKSLADATQVGFQKLRQGYKGHLTTHGEQLPTTLADLLSATGFTLKSPSPGLTYSYGVLPGSNTPYLCLSGTVETTTDLRGFVDGATSAGAKIYAGSGCPVAGGTRLVQSTFPMPVSAVIALQAPSAPTAGIPVGPSPLPLPSPTPLPPLTKQLSVGPAGLNFGTAATGSVSSASTIFITNTGTASISLQGFTTSDGFLYTNTCPATLMPSATCNLPVMFSPSRTGAYSGELRVVSDAPGSPHVVTLAGIGATPYKFTVSSGRSNLNLESSVRTAGWNGSVPVVVELTVTPSGIIGSNSSSYPALSTGVFPQGSVVYIANNGTIVGKGGDGGDGALITGNNPATATSGGAGSAGGTALRVQTATIINNKGLIAGGGGGGGGGGATWLRHKTGPNKTANSPGGGGGGGAGGYPGLAGAAGSTLSGLGDEIPAAATSGTLSMPGNGGSAVSRLTDNGDSVTGGFGGNGGQHGMPGQPGQDATGSFSGGTAESTKGGPGGAAGKAVEGNSFVTWESLGTRRGQVAP